MKMIKGKRTFFRKSSFPLAMFVAAICCIFLPGKSRAQSQWTITDPGAGGAFVTVQVGPTGFVFVGSDLAGVYRSDSSGTSWTNRGGVQGINTPHVSAIGVDPTDDDVVIAGTENSLLRSTDEGWNYTQVH